MRGDARDMRGDAREMRGDAREMRGCAKSRRVDKGQGRAAGIAHWHTGTPGTLAHPQTRAHTCMMHADGGGAPACLWASRTAS